YLLLTTCYYHPSLLLNKHPAVVFDHALGLFPFDVDHLAAVHLLNFNVIVASRFLFYRHRLRFLIAAPPSRSVGAALWLLLSSIATCLLQSHIGGVGMLGLCAVYIHFGFFLAGLL